MEKLHEVEQIYRRLRRRVDPPASRHHLRFTDDMFRCKLQIVNPGETKDVPQLHSALFPILLIRIRYLQLIQIAHCGFQQLLARSRNLSLVSVYTSQRNWYTSRSSHQRCSTVFPISDNQIINKNVLFYISPTRALQSFYNFLLSFTSILE